MGGTAGVRKPPVAGAATSGRGARASPPTMVARRRWSACERRQDRWRGARVRVGRVGGQAGDGRACRYADLGGIERVLDEVRRLVEGPFSHPEIYTSLGIRFPCGILLHGPPGCGKTMLACAIAGELGVPFFRVSGPELISGMSGESEGKLRALFDEATRRAPAVIFVDEIDAIAPKREASQRGMERRVVAQLQVRPPDEEARLLVFVCFGCCGRRAGVQAPHETRSCGADVSGHARRGVERRGQARARDRRDEPAGRDRLGAPARGAVRPRDLCWDPRHACARAHARSAHARHAPRPRC